TTQFGSTKLLDGRLGGVDIDADDLTSLVALDGGALVADASDVTIGSDVSVGTYTLTVEATDDTDLDVTLTDQDGNVIGTDSITVDNATQDIDGDQTMTFGAGDSAVSINIADTADLGAFDGESFEITGGGGDFMVGSSGAYATGGTTGDLLNFESVNLTTNGSGLDIDTLDLNSAANAQTALTSIDSAISTVNEAVGSIGAFQNRIENAVANLKTAIENLSASESVIRDLDMAEEMTSFTKNQILQQAGTAMLAQANQSSQSVLQLLGG
ncbi:MAG: flagellin, partial [Gemmatimonadota bacterium]